MPFPWKKKKNRVTRISRIVADLQSPKRGGSLVVETGFPTSLIDLFVKNRNRFTKPRSNTKKPLQPQVLDPPPPSPPPSAMHISPPLIPETSSSSVFTAVLVEEAPSVAPSDTAKVDGGEGGFLGSGPDVYRVRECGCGLGSKSVLASFLKVFVVLILIASVDKITVRITMSAFALLLLESLGNRFVYFFKPCLVANMNIIEHLRQRVSLCGWFQNLWFKTTKVCDDSESEVAAVKGGNIFVSELVVGDECSTDSLSFHEIEIVETNDVASACCEETCFVVGSELSYFVNGDRELGCPEMLEVSNGKVAVDSSEISQCLSKGSRSRRVSFKAMMVKKLVPKKLRTSEKEKRERKSEEINAEEEQGDVGKDEEENVNVSSKIKPECIREDEADDGIICSIESSTARVEEEVSMISENNTRFGNSSGNIISVLFVTALAGLVVGHFPALILTMTWCVMLKLVAATQGKSHNESAASKCSMSKS